MRFPLLRGSALGVLAQEPVVTGSMYIYIYIYMLYIYIYMYI